MGNDTLMPSAAQKVSTRLQSLELGSVGIGHKGSILSWLLSGDVTLTIIKLSTDKRNGCHWQVSPGPWPVLIATSHVDSIEGTPFLTVYYFRG